MPITVPGIGYAGLGQQTAAAQLTYRKAMGGGTRRSNTATRKRRKSAAARPAKRRASSSRSRSRSRSRRLVKGSAAAKRRMAQLRKLRRR